MSSTLIDSPPSDLAIGWRNARVLAICQALFVSAMSINLTLTGLVGYTLTDNKAYATLPFSLITVAAALTTVFASLWMQRIGRRRGFAAGALVCAIGGVVSIGAILRGDFVLFCVGTSCMGVFQAFAQYYRLAAADGVSLDRKSKAISLVMTGGVVAAVLGPLVAQWSRGAVPGNAFAGAYAVVTLLGLLSVLLLMWQYQDRFSVTKASHPSHAANESTLHEPARPVRVILRQPIFIAALANNLIGYAVMMFIMTATPLAMLDCHYGIDDSVGVIQWHLVAMYAPSFFTGWLIQRYGVTFVLLMGTALCGLCVALAGMASTLDNFYAALLCLGLGWNFMFVGGTTLLARAYRPAEQGKAQAISEFSTFAATALASLCAGQLLSRLGWATMNVAVLPLLVLAAVATLSWAWRERCTRLQLA
ncbi:MAG: MFS transporter [Pseudomonadota bacterium]